MASAHSSDLKAIGEAALAEFSQRYIARERGLQLSREAIRHSANAIRAVHRQELENAENLLKQAKEALKEAAQALEGHPELYYAGFLGDAQKEYAEASLTLAIVSGRPLPHPQELGVGLTSYLKGLGEAVGELRRYILDSLRRGDTSRCEELMEVMDEIYTLLITMDFPEGVTGGLRHTTDMVRGALERTRGDLTLALRQRELERLLAQRQEQSEEGPR
jgi:translin